LNPHNLMNPQPDTPSSKTSFSLFPYVKSFRQSSPNHFVLQSFCLSVQSSESGANALLEIESHKPIQGRHKLKQGKTNQYKAKQGSKKNRLMSLVNKATYLPPPSGAPIDQFSNSQFPIYNFPSVAALRLGVSALKISSHLRYSGGNLRR
jgi:hypothetical protein